MLFNNKYLILIATLILSPINSLADNDLVELTSRFTKWHVTYYVNPDLTVEKTSEFQIKILGDNVAKKFKKRQFSHSTSIEKFEVLEAYTIKEDGKRIEVPKDNYQITTNKGNKNNNPIFSDRTKVTVVFPDLEKNDSIYMKLKNIETESMFPNHFSASQYFWSQTAYDDVKVIFNLPKDLDFLHQIRNMNEKIQIKDNRKLIELTYENKKPIKVKRQDFSVWNEESTTGYALSTFKDYESIAKAYGDRATPKSIPTDRIKKLAKEIIADEQNKKSQARLLYNWVATNISYAGNCIGIGAVVPHDTDFILDNRMGDCKDHATLLEAFYNSVNIKSSQALVNSGSSYKLQKIPMVSSVNHVITYLPKWDIFIDSTSSSVPFDMLSFSVSDKPVLLVNNFTPNKKTPSIQVANRQELESTMKIQADGSVVGDIKLKLAGHPAIRTRAAWRYATDEQEKDWLEDAFSSQSKIGSGKMTKDDPAPLLSKFEYKIEFNKPEFILPKGANGFYVGPLIQTPKPIYSYLNYSNEEIEGYETACSNGYSIERLNYEFPERVKILAKPENFEINENHIHYKARYELLKNKLSVVREIDDKTPGNVCSAELLNLQRQTLIKISENIQMQVIYQF